MKKALMAAVALVALPMAAYAAPPDSKIVGIGLNYDKLARAGLVADKSMPVVDLGRLTDLQFVVVIVANNDPGHAIAYSFKDLENEIQALGHMQKTALDIGITPQQLGHVDANVPAGLASIDLKTVPLPLIKIEGVGDIIQADKGTKHFDTGGHITMARGDDEHLFGPSSKKKDKQTGAGHQSAAAMQTIDQDLRRGARGIYQAEHNT